MRSFQTLSSISGGLFSFLCLLCLLAASSLPQEKEMEVMRDWGAPTARAPPHLWASAVSPTPRPPHWGNITADYLTTAS